MMLGICGCFYGTIGKNKYNQADSTFLWRKSNEYQSLHIPIRLLVI